MDFSVIILAAGAGTRMRSHAPKVLHTICGKPMIYYIVREALSVSDDVHIVLYHKREMIESYLKKCLENGELKGNLAFHTQNHEAFPGTGGAFFVNEGEKSSQNSSKKIIDFAHKCVVVLNGDMPLITRETIAKIAHFLNPHNAKITAKIAISTMKLENPSGYGRVIFSDLASGACDAEVEAIIEEKDCDEPQKRVNIVNAGIYAFDRGILQNLLPKISNHNAQKEFYLTDMIALARAQGIKISAFCGDKDEFMGVNSKSELAKAECKKLESLREKAMKNGVVMHLPHTIYIEEEVEFVGQCELENGVVIKGKTLIKDSLIKSHSVVESSKIISSDIGPFAHIRPKSVVDSTHIGNFVETKAANLQGVKAGHLSYLGDCQIGKGSNVGAGVITCNYDGKAKHKTIIGENVFIGSDTQLVAPVNVESSVLIAAGSTITNDIKSGDLAISRVKQVNKAGFFKRFFGDK
ncbi:bifunctional UDP-N-acetylglucosamine diphosphorylase/glucosamine-1-phosphate N-acetyltransferase GlmU [Helicobacter sp. T3_23-1056]